MVRPTNPESALTSCVMVIAEPARLPGPIMMLPGGGVKFAGNSPFAPGGGGGGGGGGAWPGTGRGGASTDLSLGPSLPMVIVYVGNSRLSWRTFN